MTANLPSRSVYVISRLSHFPSVIVAIGDRAKPLTALAYRRHLTTYCPTGLSLSMLAYHPVQAIDEHLVQWPGLTFIGLTGHTKPVR